MKEIQAMNRMKDLIRSIRSLDRTLDIVQLEVRASPGHQLLMVALFGHFASVDDHYFVGVMYR